MNHSKENWSDPWTFDPERFSGESKEASANNLEALQPFAVGPRNCIGRKYVSSFWRVPKQMIADRDYAVLPTPRCGSSWLESFMILTSNSQTTAKIGSSVKRLSLW